MNLVKMTRHFELVVVVYCVVLLVTPIFGADDLEQEEHDEVTIRRVIRQVIFPTNPNSGNSRNPNFGGGGNPFAGGGGNRNSGCLCRPLVQCASSSQSGLSRCSMNDGTPGVCCAQQNVGLRTTRLFNRPNPHVQMRSVSNNQISAACNKGMQAHKESVQRENFLKSTNQVVLKNTPARNHFTVFKVRRKTREVHNDADQVTEASRAMRNSLGLTNLQGSHGLRKFQVSNTILANTCPRIPRCNNFAKYRTLDGSCNNLQRPLSGAANTPLQRIIPPKYNDGVWDPRQRSVNGGPLPNPRQVANNVLVDIDSPNNVFTLSVMQWAQFVDHDVAHTPFKEMLDDGEALECCINNRVPRERVHRYCDPISLDNDPFFAPKGIYCMNFVRSMLALDASCLFGHAEQVNAITHWLDASNIYGSSTEEASRLRTGRGGLLRVSNNNQLPFNDEVECEGRSRGARCFTAGDSRVNEQPGLTVIHLLWHREHNRVANQLRQLNPGWSDEQLYQEARRIVTAEYEHIVFNEWLPIILGSQFMSSFDLNTNPSGHVHDYSPNIIPQLNNEFSTGAFRFGHTLVQGVLRLVSSNGVESTLALKDHFNSPHLVQQRPEIIDDIIRALTIQPTQSFDSFVSSALTNHLFQTPIVNFGMDLIALNIHRGRDHAISTYNDMREICGLPRARSFNDIKDQIPSAIVSRMERIYSSVDDIDFFVGGISEKPVAGGLLGWTFLCVVGDQFARFKKADRFFYDIGGQPGSFSNGQLNEIKKASWARIICDNGNNMQAIQPLAMKLPDGQFNRVISCNDPAIPRVNLQHWRGERV